MFSYSFMRHAMESGILVAILCPLVGTFLVLKRFAMMGDTLSHSSFAGVAIGLFLGYDPSIFPLLYTIFTSLIIEFIRNKFKSYQEVVMSIMLTFNVGIAIILASTKKVNKSIEQFLFGSILTVTKKDITMILIVSILVIIFLLYFYKKLLYTTFDEEGAMIHGINIDLVNYIFAILTGATIGVSIKVTGLLVISSILVIPTVSALNFKKGFKATLLISIALAMLMVISGIVTSYKYNTAPGGTIAVISVIVLLVTILININNRD